MSWPNESYNDNNNNKQQQQQQQELGSVMVRASDLWSAGLEFDSRPYTAVWPSWAGKPSRYVHVTRHLDQLSLPSLQVGKSSTGLCLGLMRGVFTCVEWKVTLCDPTVSDTRDP